MRVLLDILYPPLCLHCDATLEKNRTLFCTSCLELLSLIETSERCPCCFAEDPSPCARCIERPVVIKKQAAACAAFGPAYTLTTSLEMGQEQYIPAAASLMALQWTTLHWPPPDYVAALPCSFWARCKKGGAVSYALAKALSRALHIPLCAPLSAGFDWRGFRERAVFKPAFVLRKKQEICDKRILLISLHLDDALLRAAGEALRAGFAKEVYALSFSDHMQIADFGEVKF
ncbi:MAG TPA: hypothetical protein VGJ00_10580 [Rhabdochlamydiaceae bacterium]